MEQARAKEREEAKAEEQDNRHQDTRREEAPAQEPGKTGPDGETGEAPPVPGKRDPSTTSGTNGRNLETHRTKKQNTTHIQNTISRNSNTIRYNIIIAYMIQTFRTQIPDGPRAPQLSLRAPQRSPRAS